VAYHYFTPRKETYSKKLSIYQRHSFSFELNFIKFEFFRLHIGTVIQDEEGANPESQL